MLAANRVQPGSKRFFAKFVSKWIEKNNYLEPVLQWNIVYSMPYLCNQSTKNPLCVTLPSSENGREFVFNP